MEQEIWKDIIGYENKYQVSNFGRVKSLRRTRIGKGGFEREVSECILTFKTLSPAYPQVCLFINSNRKYLLVHRLVAISFIENTENKPQINHKDGDKTNNYWKNLEWSTRSENQIHAYKTGLQKHQHGSQRFCAKLDEEKVKIIKKRLAKGELQSVLSKEFNITGSVISNIKTGKLWWRVTV